MRKNKGTYLIGTGPIAKWELYFAGNWRRESCFFSARRTEMEFVLPVAWVKHDLVFPQNALGEGTRGNVLASLLSVAVPSPIDAIAVLLRFSDSHVQVSQLVKRPGSIRAEGYPCHVFTYSSERWNLMHTWLNDLVVRKVEYSSASILSQRKVEGAKPMMVPPGANPDEVAKKMSEASLSDPPAPAAAAAQEAAPSTPVAEPPAPTDK